MSCQKTIDPSFNVCVIINQLQFSNPPKKERQLILKSIQLIFLPPLPNLMSFDFDVFNFMRNVMMTPVLLLYAIFARASAIFVLDIAALRNLITNTLLCTDYELFKMFWNEIQFTAKITTTCVFLSWLM